MALITKDQIKEAIKGMTVLEIADLVKDLEEEFGVSASTPVMVQGMVSSEGGAGQEKEEKTQFNVVLKSSGGANKIPLIKEIRTITSLGLKEAKTLADEGGVIKEKVSKEEGEKIKQTLLDLKADVVLE